MMGLGSPLLPAITTCIQEFTVFGSRRFGDVERSFIFTTYRKTPRLLKYVHNSESFSNLRKYIFKTKGVGKSFNLL